MKMQMFDVKKGDIINVPNGLYFCHNVCGYRYLKNKVGIVTSADNSVITEIAVNNHSISVATVTVQEWK